jgi:AraC-like DNA-binding protein
VAGAISSFWDIDTTWFVEYASDTIWVALASTTYYLGYVAMRQPAMFKVSAIVGGNDATDDEYFPSAQNRDLAQPDSSAIQLQILSSADTIAEVLPNADSRPQAQEVAHSPTMQPDELRPYMRRLEAFIEQQQPFLNPHLTLPKLAEDLGMSIHTLSKVINDGYNKNFFDFVNSYRIIAFQQMARSEQYQHLTLPAIAQEAGFNSKTAFNRAFKKMTGLTPREYLRTAGGISIAEDDEA